MARQRKAKGAASPDTLGFHPDSAAVDFHNPFDDGQTNTGAGSFGVQFIKEAEYLFVIAGIDANPVVPDIKNGLYT